MIRHDSIEGQKDAEDLERLKKPTLSDRYSPQRPAPWGPGLVLSGFAAALTTTALMVFGSGLAEIHPALAIGLDIVAVGGVAPTLWYWRNVAVLRWAALGVAVGVVFAWTGLVVVSL